MFAAKRRWGIGLLAMALSLGGALLWSSCSTLTPTAVAPPTVEGATFVGNAACVDCHSDYTRVFATSPHGLFHSKSQKRAGETGCESCHGPGSRHVASGGQGIDKFIVNPGKDPATCFDCHLQTHAEFRMPYHHFVPEGKMNCVDCHDPHGREIRKPKGNLALHLQGENCADCHQEQARRFVFEHEALREGCTSCHSPHGSINQKLLVNRDANLCLKCHAQRQGPGGALFIGNVEHGGRVALGTCWTSGCHSAVHGSNVDHRLRF